MSKILVKVIVDNCEDGGCPYFDKSEKLCRNPRIGWQKVESREGFPEWCPLEDND